MRKLFKKSLACCLALALCFTLFAGAISANALTTNPTYSTEDVTVAPGESTTIKFTIKDFAEIQGVILKVYVPSVVASIDKVTVEGIELVEWSDEKGEGNYQVDNENKFIKFMTLANFEGVDNVAALTFDIDVTVDAEAEADEYGYTAPVIQATDGDVLVTINGEFGKFTVVEKEPEVPAEPEYDIGFGTSRAPKLIEPWAIRFTVRARDNDIEGRPSIPLAEFSDYGVYVLPSFLAEEGAEITLDYLVANGKELSLSNGEVTENDGVYFKAYYTDGIYTYMMGAPIYYIEFAVSNGVKVFRDAVQETSLATVLENNKSSSESEANVIATMQDLYTSVVEHRGDQYTPTEKVDIPRVADTEFPEIAENNTLGYVFGTTRQPKLIEPWAIRFESRLREYTGGPTLNPTEVDDYGIVLLRGNDVNAAPATVNEIITNAKSYVMSKSNGMMSDVPEKAGYFATVFDDMIYTYQMDEEFYYARYYIKDDVMYICDTTVMVTSLPLVFEGTKNPQPTEIPVMESMLALFEAAKVHRAKFN